MVQVVVMVVVVVHGCRIQGDYLFTTSVKGVCGGEGVGR